METLKARRVWMDVLQTLRHPDVLHTLGDYRLLYSAKLSITTFRQINASRNKTKLKQHLSSHPALQNAIEGKLQSEEINHTPEDTKNKQSQNSRSKRGGGENPHHNKQITGINKHCS